MQLTVNNTQITGTQIVTKRGRVTGHKFGFSDSGKNVREIKAELKKANPGLSARKITSMANEVLRGEKDLRQQKGSAFMMAASQAGFVPDLAEMRKNTALIRFVKPVDAKEAKSKQKSIAEQVADMNEEEIKALRALLAEKLSK